MNKMLSPSDFIRRHVLQIHSSFLLVLTLVNTVLAMVGWAMEKGPFALWQEIPFAAVGLFQAYLIMFIIGVVLWVGSHQEINLRKWDVIGLLAHIPPLVIGIYLHLTRLFIGITCCCTADDEQL